MWALLFFDKAVAQQDEKIVWRIAGSGAVDIQAEDQDGTRIRPILGAQISSEFELGATGRRMGRGI